MQANNNIANIAKQQQSHFKIIKKEYSLGFEFKWISTIEAEKGKNSFILKKTPLVFPVLQDS